MKGTFSDSAEPLTVQGVCISFSENASAGANFGAKPGLDVDDPALIT